MEVLANLSGNCERLLLLFFYRVFDDLLAAIETVRRYAMSQVCLTRGWIDGQGGRTKLVM